MTQKANTPSDQPKEPIVQNDAEQAATEQAATEQTVDSAATETDALEQLQTELAAALEAKGEADEKALRLGAEMQNLRRRADLDVEKAHKFALEKFTGELLPVMDSLERALDAAQSDNPDISAMVEGIELTLSMFLTALKKFNVEQVSPEGEPFDPQLHQAMSLVENPSAEPNSVMHVMQKGYLLNGRLVRPAMVIVAKAPAATESAPKIDEQA